MYTNGANNYPSQFPTYNYGGGYNMAANYGGGFMQAAGQYQRPNANDLWCLPIQNFRIDGGNTNLYNQKVTIDWPQFRPQTPIFSGPTVGQDTTNIYANPGSNFNFNDCGYTNFHGGFYGGNQFAPNPFDCWPNQGYWPVPIPGPKPNPIDCWPFPFPPQLPNPKPDPNDCWDPQHPGTSGKGSIDGTNFRSGDGERYELRLEAGRSYNLLSDTAVGLNGTYGTVDGETVLTDVALNIRGKIVTLADDGTLRIDGKAFDRRNNNLGGDVIENRDGSYTIKTDNYEFELKASEYGIKVNIDAQRAINPEQRQGLWGVTLDGEQNTEAELQRAIQEYDYKIDDALTFDYEDNNNISGQYVPDFDEEERNDLVWNSRNPQLSSAQLALNGRGGFFAARGPNGAADDATWRMNGLQDNRVYNVFSDEGIQVNGKFKDGKATELGFVVDGDEVKVGLQGTSAVVTVNGRVVTNYNSDYINVTNGVLTVSAGDTDGEYYEFKVNARGGFLSLVADVENIGDNGTRSSGLLGDALSSNIRDGGSTGDDDGAGLLRDENGALSNSGDDMTRALREYLMDDLFDTSSGRSVYE
jgi:hypothetical protein